MNGVICLLVLCFRILGESMVLSKLPFKIVALGLFVAMTIPGSAAIFYTLPCQPMPPACHEHSHPLPDQKTHSHECCMTGQAPALPTFMARLDFSYFSIGRVAVQRPLAADLAQPPVVIADRFETPPGISPLRI